jgi:hypothetical protein
MTMFQAASRLITLMLASSMLVIAPGPTTVASAQDTWTETRFRTGCDPGPANEARAPDPFIPPPMRPTEPQEGVVFQVDLDSGSRALVGSGFNLEHALSV